MGLEKKENATRKTEKEEGAELPFCPHVIVVNSSFETIPMCVDRLEVTHVS
jgi:hypothetical protein